MATFVYVQVHVLPADPAAASLLNTLSEAATGNPVPDVIPHTDPSSISFRHCFITAADADEAYDVGYRELASKGVKCPENAVMNDYVVELEAR